MRHLAIMVFCLSVWVSGFCQDKSSNTESKPRDSLKVYYLDQVMVNFSLKETNLMKNLPTSFSVISPKQINDNRIESLPDLSGYVPNFFIPSYGAKVSTPVYIRGIGARNGPQTVSMYVDNVPSFNTAAFDFEFQDIQHIEVLRGAQGTLYGRNAIGGIVNIYTVSPLNHQGANIMAGMGNYGQFSAKAATYNKLGKNLGVSLTGFYKRDNGYFTNDLTGKKADDSESAGARMKWEWLINPKLTAKLFSHYEYISQSAFPYMNIESGRIENNDPTSYDRNLLNNGLSLRYWGNGYSINYTAGYQYLDDVMKVDQDFSSLSIFTLDQFQKEHSVSQELTIKSESNNDYQWVLGGFGFINRNKIEAPVALLEDGMDIMQQQLDAIGGNNPAVPKITYLNNRIDFPGIYKKPVTGLAAFHQSTLNHLFGVEGLSATAGIRLDYERTGIDIDAKTVGADVGIQLNQPPGIPPFDVNGDTAFIENFSKNYVELLPKVALGYEMSKDLSFYLSASKGYKSGGYNEQAFYKILQNSLMESLMENALGGIPGESEEGPSLEEQMSFAPELSWTFELGGRSKLFDQKLAVTFALFYMNVDNIQITKMVDEQGTVGRSVTNAGKSESKGIELGLRYNPVRNFTMYAEYGYSNAVLKNYIQDDLDFSGNYIPFAPQHTMNVGGGYQYELKEGAFLDKIGVNLQYNGTGKIYWTEENDVFQPFYGLINGSVFVEHNAFKLEVWGKNLLNKKYDAFYFSSTDMTGKESHLVQQGIPLRMGISVKYSFQK